MKQKISLTESQLKEMIYTKINEALEDEGFWDGFKGMFGKKSTMGNAASNAGQGIANSAKNAWNKGKEIAQGAADGVSNFAKGIKQDYQMGSMNGDNQKIANQLQQWYKQGVFGNSRQASSWIGGLINAMNKNFEGRFGQQGGAQRPQ